MGIKALLKRASRPLENGEVRSFDSERKMWGFLRSTYNKWIVSFDRKLLERHNAEDVDVLLLQYDDYVEDMEAVL